MIVRSTFLSAAKLCPLKAYYAYICGYRKISTDTLNPDLFFGRIVHDAVKTYHSQSFGAAEKLIDIADWPLSTTKTRAKAKALLRLYAKKNQVKIVAPEQPFNYALGSHDWKGRWDGIGSHGGHLWVVEHKTTKPFMFLPKPNDQIIGYYLGAKLCYGEDIYGVIVNNFDVSKIDVLIYLITFDAEEVAQWQAETETFLNYLEACREKDSYPANPNACFMYRRQCQFLGICTAEPSVRPAIIERYYEIDQQAKELDW